MVGNVGNMYQNQNHMMYQQVQPEFYNQMTPGVNWQQEMLNRINTLQQQIQNSIPQQVQTRQGFLKGRIAGSKEEVMSAQVDFAEPQFFPVGEDAIYVKKLGMDGKSQVLEYKLTNQNQNEKSNDAENNTNITAEFLDNFNTLKQSYETLTNKYDEVYNELLSIKNELGIEGVNKNES